ncbi:MAG: hypothetical protein ABI120_03030 [Gemmatimonadaceae bacterium]
MEVLAMTESRTRLNDAVCTMLTAKRAHHDARHAAWLATLDAVPEVRAALKELALPEDGIEDYFCGDIFDAGKSGIELIAEGRCDEVLTRLRQAVYGVYI